MRNYEYMRMPRIEPRIGLAGAILISALFVSYALVVFAQEPTKEEIAASGITFPVAELGGCRDKTECKSYCDQPQNMPACIEFAERHGLMSKEEAQFARKFKDRLDRGGPGGCRTPRDCEAYCSSVSNIKECIAFAEQYGVKDEHFAEAKKVLNYIRAGGQMPGGCNSRESCEAYCSDFNHAEECFAFAEKAGLTVTRRGEGGIPPGQFQKFLELAKRGETPGGCKSKHECETYCETPGHFEECVAFGEKVGFIPPEQAELIRKTGGKGPGGCRGPRECEAYCNIPEHQEDCFNFAKEHGLIAEEKLERMRGGLVHLRAGLEQAPPEVAECLKSSLEPNIIEDIQAGKLTPGQAIGDRVGECFERFGRHGGAIEIFQSAPPEVLSCVKEKLGVQFDEIKSGRLMPTAEIGDVFRVCFESIRFQQGGFEGGGGEPGMPHRGLGEFLRSAPPGVASCLKSKLGDEFEKASAGTFRPTPEFEQTIRSCFEEFQPSFEGRTQGGFGNFPPDVLSCAERILGEGALKQLKNGEFSGERFAEAAKRCFGEGKRSPIGIPSPFPGSRCQPIVCPDGKQYPTCGPGGPINYLRYPCELGSGGVTPLPLPAKDKICPALPTVDQCPAGQRKVVAFSSPECGTYYTCKSEGGEICIQVITPARDPATGYCKNFPTPCDMPQGWSRVDSCESKAYPATEDPAVRCTKEGGTWDSAANYCKFPPPGGSLLDVFRSLLFFLK